MSICHFCKATAEAIVYRHHPVDGWDVRVQVCEECLCYRLTVLHEEDIIQECVVPGWGVGLVAFGPYASFPSLPPTG
ncbi:MAG: hypothetical protein JWM80_4914 [Cyanobacteria bacterium RYN_339]|nr:hypothetical protein [Cyanobacteria bacterium RYN_339]